MKKNKISKNWINKQRRDIYVRKSQVDGYRARSAYKLIEINEKFKIFKNGISVIDLGAAPGSWSQYTAKTIKNGRIISIDLKKMEKIKNTFQIYGDFTKKETQNEIKKAFRTKVDVVLSDMAVNTTGIKKKIIRYSLCAFGNMYKIVCFFVLPSRNTHKSRLKT